MGVVPDVRGARLRPWAARPCDLVDDHRPVAGPGLPGAKQGRIHDVQPAGRRFTPRAIPEGDAAAFLTSSVAALAEEPDGER